MNLGSSTNKVHIFNVQVKTQLLMYDQGDRGQIEESQRDKTRGKK